MAEDTRALFDNPGRRLSIGAPATAAQNPRGVPGVYQSGTSSNTPGTYQSPTRGLTLVQTTRPGEGVNNDPNRAGSGGTITRNGITTRVAPTPATIPQARTSYDDFLRDNPDSPAATGALATPRQPIAPVSPTRNQQQVEAANPLTGDENMAPGGSTTPVNVPRALGFSSRGSSIPRGQDAISNANQDVQNNMRSMSQGIQDNLRGRPSVGGSGLFRRTFTNPASADRYGSYIRTLFGNLQTA